MQPYLPAKYFYVMIARVVQWLCGPIAELRKHMDRRLLRRFWTKKS